MIGLILEVVDQPGVGSGIDPADATGVNHLGGLGTVDSFAGVIPVDEEVEGQRIITHEDVEVGDKDVGAIITLGGQPDRAVLVLD